MGALPLSIVCTLVVQTAIATHVVASVAGGDDFDAQRNTARDDRK